MGRRWQCEWQHSEEAFFQAYHQATDPHVRTRLQALWHLRGGRSLQEVASLTGVAYRTVQTWVGGYRQLGMNGVTQRRQGGRGVAKLSDDQAKALNAQADTGAFRTRWDAIQWLQTPYGMTYTYWGRRHVFARLRLKKKGPRSQTPKASVADQMAWKKGGSVPNWTPSG